MYREERLFMIGKLIHSIIKDRENLKWSLYLESDENYNNLMSFFAGSAQVSNSSDISSECSLPVLPSAQ
jgi:hypothetical protein